MSKILFVDVIYYTPRGHSTVNDNLIKILKEAGHEVHMYKIGLHPKNNDFTHPDSLREYNGWEIPKLEFEKCLDEIKPDYCFWNEYNQWQNITYDKLDICKARGIKTIGYLVWERLQWEKIKHYRKYTTIIAPSMFQVKLMRKHGLYNVIPFQYGVFFDKFDAIQQPSKTPDKTVFYMCSGSGGVDNRKNIGKVFEAYKMIADETTELRVTNLSKKVFAHDEIISFIKGSDVAINVSKWDTIGIFTQESNACGVPVIVADGGPMNEFVQDKVNGLCVTGIKGKSDFVTCPSIDVEVDELAKAMMVCKNREILECLQKNARIYAEEHFDWNKNKQVILDLFEGGKNA